MIAAALSIQDPRERPEEQHRAGQRGAQALRRPGQRPAVDRRPVGPPPRASSGRCRATSSAGCAAPSSSTTCVCASGRTCSASCARSPATSASAPRKRGRPAGPHPPVGARRPAVAHRDARRRRPRAAGRPRLDVRDRPGSVLARRAAAVGDGGRARRDEPAVGPPGGGDRAGVGRAARRAPRAALVRRAALGRAARRGGDGGDGHAVRAADRQRAHRAVRPRRPRRRPAGMFIRHALVRRRVGDAPRASSPATRRSATACRALEARVRARALLDDDELHRLLRRAAARRRHVGAPLRPVVEGGSATPHACSTSPTTCSPAGPGSASPTTPTRGARATSSSRCRTASTPAGRSTAWPCTSR